MQFGFPNGSPATVATCAFSRSNRAKSLESFSQGKMNYLGKEIHTLNFPVYLISGEEDDKYFKIAYKSMQINKNVKHIKVVKSGHNTHLENPDFFVEVIDQLL